jgi:hypothetical protein
MQTWGRKFITVPLKSRHEDTYRILAAEDNTTVRIGSRTPVILMKGIYYEFSLLYTEASLIESDKPILLAQFSNSQSVDATFTGNNGDPFMVILSSVNQTREKVAFVAYDSPQITSKFFINVVVKDDAVGAIKLDNAVVPFVAIAGTGYSYAQVPLTKGNHYIESTVPGKGFIAYVYGFGGVEAYGYGVGYNLDIVLDLGSNINANGDKLLVRCDGSPSLALNAGNAFDNYLWSTKETTSAIQVANAGWYQVKASINGGCELKDSVEVQVSKPAVFLGRDTLICNPANIVLDGGDQFTHFSWSTPQGSLAGQMISASKAGIYTVEATNKYGCKARDTIKVSFADRPRLDLSRLDTLMCGKYTTTIDISADKNVSWLLESTNPKLNISNLTASVLSADEGTYPVILTAKDTFSCVATAAFNLGFFKSPVVNLGRDTTVCNPENIKLNAGAGFASYLWSTAETTPEIILHNEGVYNVNIVASNGCEARDTIKVSFADRPRLDLSRLDTLMCGKYTTTVDISADKTVSWILESTNPKLNISNLNASVLSADEGTYPVILTAKDTFSCVATTAFNLGFFKSPVVNLGKDTTICNPENIKLNAGAGFAGYLWSTAETTPEIILHNEGVYNVNIVASNGCKARDTMKVSFTDRPKIDLSNLESLICGKFETELNISSDKKVEWFVGSDPKVKFNGLSAKVLPADFGTYPVFLTAKDTFFCQSDTSFKLGFYKIPKVDFTTDAKKCSGYNLLAKYAGDADTIVSNFKWVFRGDLIANQSGLNSLLVPLGINRAQRDLELTVSQDGCSDSVSRNIIVTPKLFLSDVVKLGCEPFNAVFKATNTEVVDYFWNFGDGTPIAKGDSIISHIYQKSNFYDVKLKVVTKEGCTNEIEIDSLVHAAPIPTAGFTPLPAECLAKGNHEISYLGSADQLDTYHWDLSKLDSEEVIRNPAMAQGPLIFNLKNKPQVKIKLSVVSKFGCPSDTAIALVKRIPDFVMP